MQKFLIIMTKILSKII